METFTKQRADAPPGFFALEAAGLRWLSAASGGVRCVEVVGVTETSLDLERLESEKPNSAAAADFGRRLAATHGAGSPGFGAAPPGWSGNGFFGPLHSPLPITLPSRPHWGTFYAEDRLTPMLERASTAGVLSTGERHAFDPVLRRLAAGEFDDDDSPARTHGDLWSGNVMWTAAGGVLIDPAAQGGHRESDLAMLQLFGLPHLAAVLDAYQDVYRLQDGWQERIQLHQLFPLLVHAVLFGGGYVRQSVQAAQLYA